MSRKERRAVDAVADEINRTVGSAEGFCLDVKKWETRTRPAAGRPQGVINQQLGVSDIFVGIMWKRFGTPTGKAGSGTEEEFDEAYAQWKRKRKHKPEILFYFRESKFFPRTAAEIRQFEAVQAFREKVQAKALTWTYPSAAQFANTLRPHLVEAARAIMRGDPIGEEARGLEVASGPATGPPRAARSRQANRPNRSTSLPKVRRRLTDADRSRYLSRGFTNVKRYFREGAQDINAHVRGAKASIQEQEDGSLFVEVTSGGSVLNRARIRRETGRAGTGGSPSSRGLTSTPYSSCWSELARLEESDGALSFRLPSSVYLHGADPGGAKPKQVFDHFWGLFSERLERPL